MKTDFWVKSRITIGTLLLIGSVALSLLALKSGVPGLNKTPRTVSAKFLAGSGHAAGFGQKLGKAQLATISAAVAAATPAPTPAAPENLGFEIFESPAQLVTETTQTQGPTAHVGAYIAHDSGEPSSTFSLRKTPPTASLLFSPTFKLRL